MEGCATGMVEHRLAVEPDKVKASFAGTFGVEAPDVVVQIAEMRDKGYEPIAITSHLGRIGTSLSATSTAPHDGPPKIPSLNTRSRSAEIESRFETR